AGARNRPGKAGRVGELRSEATAGSVARIGGLADYAALIRPTGVIEPGNGFAGPPLKKARRSTTPSFAFSASNPPPVQMVGYGAGAPTQPYAAAASLSAPPAPAGWAGSPSRRRGSSPPSAPSRMRAPRSGARARARRRILPPA